MTTFSVATLSELQTALTSSAANGEADTITLTADLSASSGADFVTGTGGQDLLRIALTDAMTLTIVGGGHTVDANSFGRVLEVSSGTVSISNLILREGAVAGDGGDAHQAGGAGLGGGIYNAGDLTLTNVTVIANTASGGGGGGGGFYSCGGGGGGGPGLFAGAGGNGFDTLRTLVSDGFAAVGGTGGRGGAPNHYANQSGRGGGALGGTGGVFVDQGAAGDGGSATVGSLQVGGGGGGAGGYYGGDRSTGAGGAAVGGIFSSGTLTLSGSTITGNLAAGGGGGESPDGGSAGGAAVGGLKNTGTLSITNSTLTGNVAAGGAGGGLLLDVRVAGAADDNISGGPANQPHSGGVSLSGQAIQGQTLTATNTLADGNGLGTINYQWKSDGADIGGATGLTLVLTQAQVGQVVSVTASFTDSDGFAESATSAGSAAVTVPTAAPPTGPPPVTRGSTVDGAAVSTTTITALDGSQSQTILIAPVTAGRPDSVGVQGAADIPLVTADGISLLTIGLPTGAGLSASGPTSPQSSSTAAPAFNLAITLGGGGGDGSVIGDGANTFLQGSSGAPVLVQTLVLRGAPTMTPIAINGAATGSGVTTALLIDTRGLTGSPVLTLDNVDFAAVVGQAHITGGAGSQTVFADGAAQYMVLGADDDALHGGAGDDTIGSAGGADSLFGDDGQDYVFGGIGHDAVNGGSGDDVLQGNSGDDLVQGNAGDDRAYGGQGNDVVRGGQGNDQTWGDLGEDQVFGDLGNDTLSGGDGADIVQGNQGNDLVHGDAGDDLVYGGQGADTLRGGEGNDQVWGDLGDDLLSGDKGDDTLTGGSGSDIFVYGSGDGSDRIIDFRQSEGDHLQLSGPHGVYTTAQVGVDTVVDFGGGQAIVLANVQLSTLTSGWITG